MANKKEKKEKKVDESPKNNSKKKGLSLKGRIFLVASVLTGLAFLPTTILLMVGLLPSIVAFFVSARGVGARASTVLAMNLAGCVPFIFKLWSIGNDFEASLSILSDEQAILVMYTAAAFGYMIDWVVTGFVSSYLYQKGLSRMEAIKKRQKVLIEQWGEEVSGKAGNKEEETHH